MKLKLHDNSASRVFWFRSAEFNPYPIPLVLFPSSLSTFVSREYRLALYVKIVST